MGINRHRLISAIAALALPLAAVPALAAPNASCTLAGPTINLCNVSPLGTAQAFGSGTATVKCTAHTVATTVAACLSIGTGTGGLSTTNRTLAKGASHMPVAISEVANGTQIGNGTSYPLAGPLTFSLAAHASATQTIPIVAGFTPPVSLPPGTYTSRFATTNFRLYYAAPAGAGTGAAALGGGGIANGALNLRAVVVKSCSVTAGTLNFGATGFLATALAATAQVSVTCNTKLTTKIALNNGGYGSGPTTRAMAFGANRVTYGIYRDAAHSLAWGSNTGSNTVSLTVPAGTASATAYGLVPVQASVPPGTYTDVVGITVTY